MFKPNRAKTVSMVVVEISVEANPTCSAEYSLVFSAQKTNPSPATTILLPKRKVEFL